MERIFPSVIPDNGSEPKKGPRPEPAGTLVPGLEHVIERSYPDDGNIAWRINPNPFERNIIKDRERNNPMPVPPVVVH